MSDYDPLGAELESSGNIGFVKPSTESREHPPTRLVRVDDATALADLVTRNREFMAPWSPLRSEEFFSVEGHRADIETSLARYAQGAELPHVVLGDGGQVVGRITLRNIVLGALWSCSVGYWISEDSQGRGLATAALAHIKAIAFRELGLHRVQAETLVHNAASQAVLARNGFQRFGLAPAYLNIAGRWQDHVMFQVINPETPPN